jgi:hypothetical protein
MNSETTARLLEFTLRPVFRAAPFTAGWQSDQLRLQNENLPPADASGQPKPRPLPCLTIAAYGMGDHLAVKIDGVYAAEIMLHLICRVSGVTPESALQIETLAKAVDAAFRASGAALLASEKWTMLDRVIPGEEQREVDGNTRVLTLPYELVAYLA